MNTRIVGSSSIAAFMVAGVLALAGCTETTTTTGGSCAGFAGPSGQSCSTIPPGQGIVGNAGTTIQVLVSSPQLPSAGTPGTEVDLTAVVLDGTGQALSGQVVTFSTIPDPSAFVSGISGGGTTDTNGRVTAKLNLGANKSNRTITVTVTSNGASNTNTVGVTGTSITVSGSTSLQFGNSTSLIFSLKDSAGTPIPNAPMTFASQAGNAIAPSSTVTSSSGQITAVVTGTNSAAASDVLTATGGGVSVATTLNVSTASFAFTTPAAFIDIPLGAPTTTLNIHWTQGGVAQSGQLVTFSTSRGTISGNPATVDGAGNTPGVSIVSNVSAGPAVITAQGAGNPGPAATLNVNFVAVTAASVAVQAVPGVIKVSAVPPNPNQTDNVSTITVTVRDANNNLVKNASVTFDNGNDTSNGSLPTAIATTDATGTASVTYVAGKSTPAVTITAKVDKVNGVPVPLVSASTTLSVGGASLFVRLGTDNFVIPLPTPDPDLQKKYSAIVTDASGNAIVGQQVRFTLTPTQYGKGTFQFNDTAGQWLPTNGLPQPLPPAAFIGPAFCPSEDNGGTPLAVNVPGNANNGIVDPNEDVNGNGTLQPGNVASVNGSATTDANGIAIATITYPKSYAFWTEVKLQASAATVSNEPPTTATFLLPGLASDYTSKNVSPPGQISPFGTNQSCASPL